MKYLAFDSEISKEIPEGVDDWHSLCPLGISCAATLTSDGEALTWYSPILGGKMHASKMTPHHCQELAQYLVEKQADGYIVVTWNGLGFDFDVLAEECQDLISFDNLRELALNHIDVFFAMLCSKGFGVGLAAAAAGAGVAGKTEGMSGAKAPEMWAKDRVSQEIVLEYVAQDVQATADVYEAIVKAGRLKWTSKSGRPNSWYFGELLPVNRALETPEPDTSWMSEPWKREKFYGWTIIKE